MKKIILSTLIMAALAGTAKAQIAFGPELGLNITNVNETDDYNSDNYTDKVGFKIGGLVEVPLSYNFYLQPGLFFTTKGAKIYDPSTDNNATLNINYLELPVNVLYKFGRRSGNRFFVGAGFYFAQAAGGKVSESGVSVKLHIGDDPNTDDIKGFDAGFDAQIGYQLQSGFIFRLQSQSGLANIAPGGNGDYTVRNEAFNISVAYLLTGVKHHKIDKRKKADVR